VTPVLLVPLTVAVNVCCCDGCKETVDGASVTVTGMRLMVALADLVASAVLVAVTVTAWELAIEGGAV